MLSAPDTFDSRKFVTIAVGKASIAMTQGAIDALGARVSRALVIHKASSVDETLPLLPAGGEVRAIPSAHPVPDERSLTAGRALLDAVDSLASDDVLVFLISGGTSSLVEVLADGVHLDDLAAFNRAALASGDGIEAINLGRARLSRIKAGGLTQRLRGRRAIALFISDVPTDDPAVIGSGLLAPVFGDAVEREIVATVTEACAAAASCARTLSVGSPISVRDSRFEGDVAEVAKQLLRECGSTPVWFAAGGESTVRLPTTPGRGGRNQHLALLVARAIQGQADVACLAIGTDGNDGVTDDAGALVDGGTWQRILDAGIDPQRSLDEADSGTALEASGDLIHTGPTGTNVGDVFLLARGAARGDAGVPVL